MTSSSDGAPVILSIQVGMPQAYGAEGAADEMDRAWETSFVKQPVSGPRWLGRENLDGNQQADTKNHGGPDKAALCYSVAHYPRWRAELPGFDPPHGGFGENFTIAGQSEETVCLGDTYAIGDVRVQVSQPRGPCWKIERRWRMPGLTARVRETGRTGWYFRVLTEGMVEAGMALALVERPCPEWSIARVNAAINNRADRESAAALAANAYLAPVVRRVMAKRATTHPQ
jgi:MOSC domain-containing protein YiiM